MSADGLKSPLAFTRKNYNGMPLWNRVLTVDGEGLFVVGNVCDTCAFFFERMSETNTKLEVSELRNILEKGLTEIHQEASSTLAQLMPQSDYTAALLKIRPEQVISRGPNDYFAREDFEFEDFMVDPGPPEPHDPRTSYYRVAGRNGVELESDYGIARGYDFLIPFSSEQALNADRVSYFVSALERGVTPTAIGISTLDIKGPSVKDRTHWCLAHYILDGHHKLAAAACTGKEITLLAFITHDHGVSSKAHIAELLATYPR